MGKPGSPGGTTSRGFEGRTLHGSPRISCLMRQNGEKVAALSLREETRAPERVPARRNVAEVVGHRVVSNKLACSTLEKGAAQVNGDLDRREAAVIRRPQSIETAHAHRVRSEVEIEDRQRPRVT